MMMFASILAQDFNFDTTSDDAATAFFVVILIAAVIFAFFTGWLAEQKGHSGIIWMVLGFLFNFLALLTIGFAPSRPKKGENVMHAPGTGPLGPPANPGSGEWKSAFREPGGGAVPPANP